MRLTELSGQTDFPTNDFDEASAETLELLVMNREIVSSSHEIAEGVSFLYKAGHVALTATANNVLPTTRAEAVSYGVTLYESVATMLRPLTDPSIHNGLNANKAMLNAHLRLKRRFINELSDANDQFLTEMPHTAQVVAAGGEREFPQDVSFVLAGAALARQLEQYAADPSLLLQ